MANFPQWVEPMLATLTKERFSNPRWIYEQKLDGFRCLAFRHGKAVELLSRNQLRLNDTYPLLAPALASLPTREFILDGEIVAFAAGRSTFENLQQQRHKKVDIYYYVFDVLWLDGRDLRRLPLLDRKRLLEETFSFEGPIKRVDYLKEHGEMLYNEACKHGWEGVIAKNGESIYNAGRSRDWLKFKCSLGQEFVVGGFTAPQGGRVGFGALLVGYYDKIGRLIYAGKVGTGYNNELLHDLRGRMDKLRFERAPFEPHADLPRRDVFWVRPQLVAQVEFSEWTSGGALRHPRFVGLRTDKAATEVHREQPAT